VSAASPFVIGKRVMFPLWPRPIALATFSCHWAAVAALVRLHQPDFKSTGGDKPEDLAAEVGLREALAVAKARGVPGPEVPPLRNGIRMQPRCICDSGDLHFANCPKATPTNRITMGDGE
jgi:hypothetical protein